MKPAFDKYPDGLLPVIIQDAETLEVLMLGFMNETAWEKSSQDGRVTFFSRSRQRLWTKGETSGHFLDIISMHLDCDADTLLIRARPAGPVCHTGAKTCFGEGAAGFTLSALESVIAERKKADPSVSYTARLFDKGMNAMAQKVGEEAVELVIESKDDNPERFLNEAADLMFHYLVLLQAKGHSLSEVIGVLEARHRNG